MPDDKSQIGGLDRSQVSATEDYEVRRLAERHGISLEQARELIERHGNDRETLDQAASRLSP
jgi:hypothetical protein